MKMKEKEYGIKFDGETLSIYLSWHKKVYHTWPKFQCKTVNSETGLWHSLTYGKVFLSSGRVGLFDGLDTLLPRLDRTVMLKYLSPLEISNRKEGGYYVWNPDKKRVLPVWYQENREKISRACSEYINTIPWEVRKEAGAFKNGYIAGNQWFLIKQSQLYPPFIDLMRANPALAYSFAHRKVLGLKTKRLGRKDTERLLSGKHRKIAAFLGLEDSNAVLNILKKVPASACIRHTMQNFLGNLKRKELWKTLLHLETIDEAVLNFYGSMRNYPKYFTPNKIFVEDITAHFPTYKELWVDCIRPLHHIFYYLDDEKHDFKSVAQMRNKYEKVIQILNRQDLPARERKYPTPPLKGSDIIEPILTRRELFEEGFDQKNCIYSYDKDIVAGRYYVYRVLAPERATISLTKESNGRGRRKVWRIEEIKTRANNPAGWETIDVVNDWFEQVSI